MLKLGTALIVGVLLSAQAAPIPEHSQKAPDNQRHQQNKPELPGSERVPVFVKIIPPTQSQADLDRQKTKETAAATTEKRLADLTGDLAKYTRWLAFGTAILAGLTAGLLFLGFLQRGDNKRAIEATEKSAKAAEDSARASMQMARPFIAIDTVELENVAAGEIPRATISLKNTGASAALSLTETAVMGIDFYPAPQRAPTVRGGVVRPSQPLGPNTSIYLTVEFPKPLQAHNIEGLKNNTMALYVFGAATYTDVFGDTHTYEFALFSNASVDVWGGHMAAFIGDPALNESEHNIATRKEPKA